MTPLLTPEMVSLIKEDSCYLFQAKFTHFQLVLVQSDSEEIKIAGINFLKLVFLFIWHHCPVGTPGYGHISSVNCHPPMKGH